MRRTLAPLLLALAASGTALVPAQVPVRAPAATNLEGEHFRIVAHFAHRPSAARALQAAEAGRRAVARWFAPRAGGPLLDVHLYRTAEDYRAADRRLTGGRFQRNMAFAHYATRSAHVAVQPELSDAAMEVIGPGFQLLRLVAHEAAHLVRYDSFRNHRSHPRWLADGLATWAEAVALAELGLLDTLEEHPEFAAKILSVQALAEAGRLPPLPAVLEGRLDDLEFFEVYSVHWLVFHALVERRGDALRDWFAELRRLGGGGDFDRRAAETVAAMLAGGDLDALDRELRAVTAALRPRWDQRIRVLGTAGERWEQAAFDRNAICWRVAPAGPDWVLRGAVRILPGSRRQMNLLLGRREGGFVTVALAAGFGVTVFDHRAEGNQWRQVASRRCEVALDEPVAFAVAGTTTGGTSTLAVEIDGETVLETRLPVPLDGPWGLGAQARSAGLWTGIELTSR